MSSGFPKSALVSLFMWQISMFAQSATSITVQVSSPRPLADAAAQLELQTGIAINYEDTPYAFAGDTSDVTRSVMPAANQAAYPNARIIIPKGGALSISPIPTSAGTNPTTTESNAINALIGAYSANQLPGTYMSLWQDGAFFLVPSTSRNASGSETALVPVLSVPVTIPVAERTAIDTLTAILDQVKTSSGVKVGVGSIPLTIFARAKVSLGANNETARSVIGRMFTMLAPRTSDGSALSSLSYKLLFDPCLKYYMFNAAMIQSTPAKPVTQAAPAKVTPSSGPNPYARPSSK